MQKNCADLKFVIHETSVKYSYFFKPKILISPLSLLYEVGNIRLYIHDFLCNRGKCIVKHKIVISTWIKIGTNWSSVDLLTLVNGTEITAILVNVKVGAVKNVNIDIVTATPCTEDVPDT